MGQGTVDALYDGDASVLTIMDESSHRRAIYQDFGRIYGDKQNNNAICSAIKALMTLQLSDAIQYLPRKRTFNFLF